MISWYNRWWDKFLNAAPFQRNQSKRHLQEAQSNVISFWSYFRLLSTISSGYSRANHLTKEVALSKRIFSSSSLPQKKKAERAPANSKRHLGVLKSPRLFFFFTSVISLRWVVVALNKPRTCQSYLMMLSRRIHHSKLVNPSMILLNT